MWPRLALRALVRLWSQFPAVLLVGPRQVGKTTLARQFLPDAAYFDLEDPQTQERFLEEPRFQIERAGSDPLILDEAQQVPVVFNALRGVIDAARKTMGRFLILGSAQPTLVRAVSETLAGRIGILDLDPLTCSEAVQGPSPVEPDHVWLKGGFPDALSGEFRTWWDAYLRTYIERDLPYLGLQPQPILFRRLMTMLAHQQGGLLNLSQLGASLGVTHPTIQRYVTWLEQTFLLFRLPPYFRNIGKRLVKSPKAYLRDSGLAHHLLNLPDLDAVRAHPAHGSTWEGFVIQDIIRRERVVHPHTQFYFWRTAAGAEVDLILDRGTEKIGIEIKAGGAENMRAVRHLEAALHDIEASRGFILDQRTGVTPMSPRIERRGYFEDLDWLP